MGRNPPTCALLGDIATSHLDGVGATASGASVASGDTAAACPAIRAAWLNAVARAVVTHRGELAELADAGTGLGTQHLTGEVDRTASRPCFHMAVGGHWRAAIVPSATSVGAAALRRFACRGILDAALTAPPQAAILCGIPRRLGGNL